MGNHAQGVAFATDTLGISARTIMPVTAPIYSKARGNENVVENAGFPPERNDKIKEA
jgi:threonine dehydratase